MGILRFFLQLFREQMGISAISYQMRLFFTVSLQIVREQMGIWLKMLALKTKMGTHLFARILYFDSLEIQFENPLVDSYLVRWVEQPKSVATAP